MEWNKWNQWCSQSYFSVMIRANTYFPINQTFSESLVPSWLFVTLTVLSLAAYCRLVKQIHLLTKSLFIQWQKMQTNVISLITCILLSTMQQDNSYNSAMIFGCKHPKITTECQHFNLEMMVLFQMFPSLCLWLCVFMCKHFCLPGIGFSALIMGMATEWGSYQHANPFRNMGKHWHCFLIQAWCVVDNHAERWLYCLLCLLDF